MLNKTAREILVIEGILTSSSDDEVDEVPLDEVDVVNSNFDFEIPPTVDEFGFAEFRHDNGSTESRSTRSPMRVHRYD